MKERLKDGDKEVVYDSVIQAQMDEEEMQMDREWYNADETGVADEVGCGSCSSAAHILMCVPQERVHFHGTDDYVKKKEEELAKRQVKKLSARQTALNEDNDKWERQRLTASGVVTEISVATDFDDDLEVRVQLIVHNTVPPFLDGRVTYTKQQEMVSCVKVGKLRFGARNAD